MIRKYAEFFCWKNVSSFCSAKATHIFSAKKFRILYIESVKTVNEMTLNELVKLTMLWTTGPRLVHECGRGFESHFWNHVMYSTLNKQQQDEICWANTTDCFICIKLAHLYWDKNTYMNHLIRLKCIHFTIHRIHHTRSLTWVLVTYLLMKNMYICTLFATSLTEAMFAVILTYHIGMNRHVIRMDGQI